MKVPRSDEQLLVERLANLLSSTPDMWEKGNCTLQMKYIPPPVDPASSLMEKLIAWELNLDMYRTPAFWISNGFMFFKLYRPVEIEFRFLNKVRLWLAVRRVLKMLRRTAANEHVKICLEQLDKAIQPVPAKAEIDYDTLSAEVIDYTPGGWA